MPETRDAIAMLTSSRGMPTRAHGAPYSAATAPAGASEDEHPPGTAGDAHDPHEAPSATSLEADSRRPGVMQLVLDLKPGGTQRLTIEIVRRLSNRFRMAVCCLDEPGEWAADLGDIPVVALNREPGFHPSLGARIASLAADLKASVIHCHHYSPFVYGTIAGRLSRGLTIVYTEHGRLSDGPPSWKRRLANVVLSRLSGPAFAVSHDLRRYMLAEGFRGQPIGVIHNGIDVGPRPTPADRAGARRELGIDNGAFVVGTVARLDPVKDLVSLLNAVARLRGSVPNVRLVIVGDGPEQTILAEAIARADAEAIVTITGYRADARDLLPAFDVYANASVSEGISLTILEAMAAALPVVATRVGGTPEIVLEGETGMLVAPRAVGQLTAALSTLAADPTQRLTLGAAGRQRVERSFTIERMVDAYAREYLRAQR